MVVVTQPARISPVVVVAQYFVLVFDEKMIIVIIFVDIVIIFVDI